MIGILTPLGQGICRHCGRPITEWRSDLELHPFWSHSASGQRPCHDAPMAEPLPKESK